MTGRSWPAAPAPASADVLRAVLDAARVVHSDPDVSVALDVDIEPRSGVPVLTGHLPTWDDVVRAGHGAAKRWAELRADNPGDVVVDVAVNVAVDDSVAGGEPAAREAEHDRIRTGEIPDSADVVVVGAGICGMMTAAQLSRAGLQVAVVDAATRIGDLTTSWNNGMVHPGHDPLPGTRKALLNVEGNAGWSSVMASLGLDLQRRPSLVVGFGTDDEPRLAALLAKAAANHVPGAVLISGDQAREIEPRLSASISGALCCPTTASIDPVRVAQALAGAVRRRGGTVTLTAPVSAITVESGRVTGVQVAGKHLAAPVVVNAAGVHADLLAATAGSRRYSLHPRRGSLVLFDPTADEPYATSVGPIPGEYSKGGGMTARPDGCTTGGPTAVEQQSRIALPPRQAEVDHILALGEKIYPAFPLDSIVHVGSAVRAVTYGEDFVIGPAPGVVGLLDVAGTQSPAIAAAPAIAARVLSALQHLGYVSDRM